jgi:hypothetical protein
MERLVAAVGDHGEVRYAVADPAAVSGRPHCRQQADIRPELERGQRLTSIRSEGLHLREIVGSRALRPATFRRQEAFTALERRGDRCERGR